MSKLTVVTINFCLDMTDPKSDSAYVGTLVVDEASREAAIAWRELKGLGRLAGILTRDIGESLYMSLVTHALGTDSKTLKERMTWMVEHSSIFFDFDDLGPDEEGNPRNVFKFANTRYWEALAEAPERWMHFKY